MTLRPESPSTEKVYSVFSQTFKKLLGPARWLTQQVKVPATKPDDLSLNSDTYMEEERTDSTHMLWHGHTHTSR